MMYLVDAGELIPVEGTSARDAAQLASLATGKEPKAGQPVVVYPVERSARTVAQMVQALRMGGAQQQHLFFKDKKERFLWEQSQLK